MLTDRTLKGARANGKIQKFADSGGLVAVLSAAGTMTWRLRYRWEGREQVLTFGRYPDISLAEARKLREDAKALLRAGLNPAQNSEKEETRRTLEPYARAWLKRASNAWVPGHTVTVVRRLERDVFPWLGASPIEAIQPPAVLAVLRRIEERGAIETAHRVRQILNQVFDAAVAEGLRHDNPARALQRVLTPVKEKHHAAFTEPGDVARLLAALHGYQGGLIVRAALRLAPLVFVRPGELRTAEWAEIDLDNALWTIPATKMKMRESHVVPLSKQAIAILGEVRPLSGGGRFVFPSPRTGDRPMSNNAVLAALRTLGFTSDEMTGHGFRAMARTMLDEQLGVRPDFIEQQLAHVQRDPNGRAYNRTKHLTERREMMQRWGDYLDQLREGAGPHRGSARAS